jgi:hypothetical protein
MSVLSFDPSGHGGVSTVGAETLGGARNKINAVNAFNDNARRAASRRVTKNALRNVLGNENETTPLAIPIPATGNISPGVDGAITTEDDGPIIAIANPDDTAKTPTRGRTYQRSNSSPSPSSSPSRSPSRLRRAASFAGRAAAVAAGTALGGPVGGGAVAGFLMSRGGKDGSPVTPTRQQNDTAPESDKQDAAGAQAPDACTEKASSVVSKISQGNEALYDIIGDMQKRIATHKEISERVRAMKAELERLRELEQNMPKPTTPEGIAQKALATAAIESCSANMGGMESAVDELVSTIKRLKQQIIEIGDTDYDITRTLEDITGPSVA